MEKYNLKIINTSKFKHTQIAIFFTLPIDRNIAVRNALLSSVLVRGNETYPTMQDIALKLQDMYDSSLGITVQKFGENHSLCIILELLDDKYTFGGENLFKQAIELIVDILAKSTKNNLLNDEYIKQEKIKLIDNIKNKENDKKLYATQKCIESMCKNEAFGVPQQGYWSDVELITTEILSEHFKMLLDTAKVDIIVCGNVESSNVENIINSNFKFLNERENIIKREYISINPKKENIVKEKSDVTQGKLVMGYRVTDNCPNEKYLASIYNCILGGSMTSKLFQNVREKESLAYYCNSRYIKQNGIILVNSGIEISNYEKAISLINKQIEDMQNGNITESEFEACKKYFINGLKLMQDDVSEIITFNIINTILGDNEMVEDVINEIKKIQIHEIIEFAAKIKLDTIYFLTSRGDNNDTK